MPLFLCVESAKGERKVCDIMPSASQPWAAALLQYLEAKCATLNAGRPAGWEQFYVGDAQLNPVQGG